MEHVVGLVKYPFQVKRNFNHRLIRQTDRSLGDVHREVGNPLKVVVDL